VCITPSEAAAVERVSFRTALRRAHPSGWGIKLDALSPSHVASPTLHPSRLAYARETSDDRLSYARFPGRLLPSHGRAGARWRRGPGNPADARYYAPAERAPHRS